MFPPYTIDTSILMIDYLAIIDNLLVNGKLRVNNVMCMACKGDDQK